MTKEGKIKRIISIFLLIFLISFISSYSQSDPKYTQFDTQTKGNFDSSMCAQGQDFLVQIVPFGCTPSVVRSDLLEEQNVPVFCQLGATKINPLIEVDAIEGISFSGEYPEEISGVGFHPASSALSIKENLNSPVLNNIGYAVIVLKKQENASQMPDFVTGNLTAKLNYDIKNAFGIGKATFYTPLLTDSDWNDKYKQYGFWGGRGYIRAESIEEEKAEIAVYDGVNRRVSSHTIEKGKSSPKIFIPGFDCLAGLELKLKDIENPDTKAQLEINGEITEVGENGKFLDNKCTLRKLEKQGLVQMITITCREDEGSNTFNLAISPKVNLTIGDTQGTYGIGDKLYEADGESIYLGVIGTKADTGNLEDLYIRLVKSPQSANKLSDSELTQIARYDKAFKWKKTSAVGRELGRISEGSAALLESVTRQLISGTKIDDKIIEYKKSREFENTKVVLNDLSAPKNKDLSESGEELGQRMSCASSLSEFDAKYCKAGDNVFVPEGRLTETNFKDNSWSISTLITFNNSWIIKTGDNEWELSQSNNPTGGEKINDSIVNEIYLNNLIKNIKSGDSVYNIKDFIELIKKDKSEIPSNINELYETAMEEYKSVYSSFPNEKYPENAVSSVGEEAMFESIKLAWYLQQKKTAIELCESFSRKFPSSKKNTNDYCKNEIKLSSEEVASKDTIINGKLKTIIFKGINEPTMEDYGVEIFIKGSEEKYTGQRFLQKGERAYLSKDEFISLEKIEKNYVVFDAASIRESKGRETFWKTNKLNINKSGYEIIGENNYEIRVNEINLKKVAKVEIIPNVDKSGTEAHFSFKVGIEKRGIELSPDRIQEKINSLDDSLNKWKKRSETLGNVVKGFKTACLGVGTYTTFKNLLSGGATAIARQSVMKGAGGWYEKCEDMISTNTYSTMNECLLRESDNIESAVALEDTAIQQINNELQNIQKGSEKKDTGFLGKLTGEEIYDENEIRRKFLPSVQEELLKEGEINNPFNPEESFIIEENKEDVIFNSLSEDNDLSKYVSMADARDIKKYLWIKKNEKSTEDDKKRAEAKIYSILSNIKGAGESELERETLAKKYNVPEIDYGSSEKLRKMTFSSDIIFNEIRNKFTNPETISNGNSFVRIFRDRATGKEYLIELDNDYSIVQTYKIDNSVLNIADENSINPLKLNYQKISSSSYNNEYKNPELRYYETEPYKGRPSIVPFDTENGWYTSIGQSVPVLSNIAPYESSGRVSSFYVCNIGPNGKEENKAGDDICELINTGTGQPYNVFPGLIPEEAERIILEANKAIERASKLYEPGLSGYVSISNKAPKVKIGSPAVNIPDIRCQDLMSPEDCNLLFNVCDPVVCPSSRCDFGGSYPVQDVIQSGIIGSLLLCLPNAREGIKVPVCLSGVKAGLDGHLSVLDAHRSCLQESLDTGKTVGVCDEIYSIHLCEFFWRQSFPVAKLAIPKVFEFLSGQNRRGGGEYMNVAGAWANADKSFDFFTSYYALNSKNLFKTRVTEKVGDAVCRNSISGVFPDSANLMDSLTDPRTPPQFHGRFDEIPFTSATVPPISHYKVFYHIYAGDQTRAIYKVYLKGAEGSTFYQDTSSTKFIDSGFIPAGGTVSETKDFTAPAGYKELCINVNGQEECGFKQVSTSFTVNYIEDKYLQEQSTKTNITTEKECISGSMSLYGLINPNLQSGAEEAISPEIYNRGIIRICATESPGKGTDGKYQGEDARWVAIGYCDDNQNIKCWQDMEGVKKVIESVDIEGETLEEQNQNYLEVLTREENYLTKEKIDEEISTIQSKREEMERINRVNKIINKIFWNNQKAQLLFLRADAYADLIRGIFGGIKEEEIVEEAISDTPDKEEEFTKCEDCGKGLSVCSEEECSKIGKILEKNCVFESSELGGLCYERDLDDRSYIIFNEIDREEANFIRLINEAVKQGLVDAECVNYARLLMESSELNNVPDPALLLSIMQELTKCQNIGCNEKGQGGLMRVPCIEGKDDYSPDWKQPNVNIDTGAKILRDKYNTYKEGKIFQGACAEEYKIKKYYGWEAAMRGYMGWGCDKNLPEQDEFVDRITARWEELKSIEI